MEMATYILFVIISTSPICWSAQGATSRQAEEKQVLEKLLETYDSRIRPSVSNGTEGSVKVTVNVGLRDITAISDYDMDFIVQVSLRQEWIDERLKYEDKGMLPYLTLTDVAKLWNPDLFVQNEKDSHLQKAFLRIYPSGRIFYSSRMSLTLWCHMELKRFPFDTQHCNINLGSFGLTTDVQELVWREDSPVQVSRDVNVMGFTLGRVKSETCKNVVDGENYSSLTVSMFFKRDLSYYILHTFLPSSVLVAVSWASFWIDSRAVVARILLVLSTLFAMSSLTTDIEASVPHVSYVKAMDLWASVCFTFLLAALLEFAVVNATSPPERQPSGTKSEETSTTVDLNSLVSQSKDSTQSQSKGSHPSPTPFYQWLLSRLPRDPHRIDSLARALFPTLFFSFVILYFIGYHFFDSSNKVQ